MWKKITEFKHENKLIVSRAKSTYPERVAGVPGMLFIDDDHVWYIFSNHFNGDYLRSGSGTARKYGYDFSFSVGKDGRDAESRWGMRFKSILAKGVNK